MKNKRNKNKLNYKNKLKNMKKNYSNNKMIY